MKEKFLKFYLQKNRFLKVVKLGKHEGKFFTVFTSNLDKIAIQNIDIFKANITESQCIIFKYFLHLCLVMRIFLSLHNDFKCRFCF